MPQDSSNSSTVMRHKGKLHMQGGRLNWIDTIKSLAVLAVIFDHNYNYLYHNKTLWSFSYFSVTAFIFVMGVTSSISLSKHENFQPLVYIKKRSVSIIYPYLIASLIYHIYQNRGIFFLVSFLKQLVTFSASSPFYFIFLYLQLVLIVPWLFKIYTGKGTVTQFLIVGILAIIGTLLTTNTLIEGIYGGGGRILGGTYLFVCGLGILFYFYIKHLFKLIPSVVIFLLSITTLCFFLTYDLFQQARSNPPNTYLIVYTMALCGLVFSLNNLVVVKLSFLSNIVTFSNIIGRYSLEIFLYHLLFINLAYKIAHPMNIWILRVYIMTAAIIPPILISILGRKIKTYLDLRKVGFMAVHGTSEKAK